MAMFEGTIIFDRRLREVVEGYADSLGWTYWESAPESPYTDFAPPAGMYGCLRATDTNPVALLERMRWTVEILKGEGATALRQKIVCVFFDSKIGYDGISDLDEEDLINEDEAPIIEIEAVSVTESDLQELQADALGG